MEISQPFRRCETPFRMASRLRNGGFQGVENSQPFRSCETVVPGCEMALVCQGGFLQRVQGGCEMVSQRRSIFAARRGIFAAAFEGCKKIFAAECDFRSGPLLGAKFRRPCSLLAFELLLIHNFLISLLLTFLLILIIQKPILYQNKLKLKH